MDKKMVKLMTLPKNSDTSKVFSDMKEYDK